LLAKCSAILGLLTLLGGTYFFGIRPGQLTWGATAQELAQPLPGDNLVRDPTFCATRAVTIAARPEDIWPWIVQIGWNRAGFYGDDLIENLGSSRGIRSATAILPELQGLAAGDRVYMSTVAYLVVQSMTRNRFFTWAADVRYPSGSYTWALFPIDRNHTRVLFRIRFHHHWLEPKLAALDLFTEFAGHVAVRRMLLGLRDRTEGRPIQSLAIQGFEITMWSFAIVEFLLAVTLIFFRHRWRRAWITALLAALVLLFALYARQPIWIGAALQLPVLAAIVWAWRADANVA
jgi:hypothetical protein